MSLLNKYTSIILVLLFVSGISAFFLCKPTLLTETSFSYAVYDENKHLLRLTLSRDDKYRLFTPLKKISPLLISGTLLQEDQYFRWHFGLNPLAMIKATWQTYFVKSRRIGASTITMQLARIRFGIDSKTYSGKIMQILRALQLEVYYSKNDILEAYLNLAPYGNNIEGVGAASLIYFGKPAKDLTLAEALTLSVIPQNPTQRTPKQKNLKDIRAKLFKRWLNLHPEDNNKTAAMDLPLQMQNTHDLPFLAPHFVNSVLTQSPTDEHEIVTSLNLQLQKIVEKGTRHYLARKNNIGVYNSAILLVDTRDMSIKALVGSENFFNPAIQGQINGTDIKRSPGSALKPFIYGLALDQGLIHPNTVLKDVPHSFGSYNPENFDYEFMGPVKAKDALTLSRNIPAIFLAEQLEKPTLYQFLEAAHITHLKSEAHYGLALVLGGAELTMQELAGLYAALVNEGVWQPLRFQKNQIDKTNVRLLSPEASFLVLDMLKDTPRPVIDSFGGNRKGTQVSWKTGTSSGYRDAWAVGSFGPYVLAVWVGNFNNKGNPAFVGKAIAAPLFFELIDAIQNEKGVLASRIPNPAELHLAKIPVCKASGMLPTRYCQQTELTWFIPGKSPIKTDTIYREVAVDKMTGLRSCHFNQNTRFEIYEFWTSDFLKIFKQAGIQPRTPPLYDPQCSLMEASNTGISPQITSPQAQTNYIIRANSSSNSLVPLTAVTDADVKDIYWFINETYLGKTRRDQPFLWFAQAGNFTVRVLDDHGRSDARDLMIHVDS